MHLFKKAMTILIIVVLSILTDSCKNSTEPDAIAKGDLEITVGSDGYSRPTGIKVSLVGIDSVVVLDSYGKAFFKDLPEGTYEILAYLERVGSTKAYIKVLPNTLNKITVYLQTGLTLEPKIVFTDYQPLPKTSVGDTVRINMSITDGNTTYNNMQIVINSNFDGKLFEGTPKPDGKLAFKSANLSKNKHKIIVIAKDDQGNITKDSISISNILPPKIKLSSSGNHFPQIDLNWTVCNDITFDKYEIYRTTNSDNYYSQLVTTIKDKNVITYIDQQPIANDSIKYYMVSYNKEGEKSTSNTIRISNYIDALFSYNIKDAVFNTTLPLVYFTTTDKRLVVYDFDTKKITKTIQLISEPNFLEIGDCGSGVELFVPDMDGFLSIFDPVTLSKKAYLNCNSAIYSVALDNKGIFYAVVNPITSSGSAIKSFNRQTGQLISATGNNINYSNNRILRNAVSNELFVIFNYYSTNSVYYVKADDNGNLSNLRYLNHSLPINPNISKISLNGEYILTSSWGTILRADNTLISLGSLPRGSLTYSDFNFKDNGSTIYASCSNSNFIYVFDFNSRNNTKQIPIIGYPFKFIIKNSQILSIGKTSTDGYSYRLIFERININ